jgi:nucleoside-diphosphate-sugar epimerase
MLSNKINNIVITGANGFIGNAFVNFFAKKEFTVIALVRKIPNDKIPNVAYKIYEMESESAFDFLNENSILIHCAYLKSEKLIDNQDINLFAGKHLINEAQRKNIQKCVFISSISVESTSGTYYSNQKKELENLFLQNNHLIVRPSLVIGNGGLFLKTISTLRNTKVLPLINGGKQPIFYVGIDDLVQYVFYCLDNNVNDIQQVTNPKPIIYKDFYLQIAKSLNFKIIPIPVPVLLMKLAVYLNSFLPKPIITQDNLKGLLEVPNLKIVSQNDFEFQKLKDILN